MFAYIDSNAKISQASKMIGHDALSMSSQTLSGTALAIIVAGAAIVLSLLSFAANLPATAVLAYQAPALTSYMRLRARAHPVSVTKNTNRPWSALTTMSPVLVCAVVKAEDRGFFQHHGFEAGATLRAAIRYMLGRQGAGGSTITQQLARNIYLSPARSPSRKLRELLITRRLERTLSKQRILELYLNLAEWGDGVWGADEGAQYYFGVSPRDVNAFEASFLAAMLAAPSRPPTRENGERVYLVQRRVLRQMAISGLISDGESERALIAAANWDKKVYDDGPWRVALTRSAAWYRHAQAPPISSGYPPADSVWRSCGYKQELANE